MRCSIQQVYIYGTNLLNIIYFLSKRFAVVIFVLLMSQKCHSLHSTWQSKSRPIPEILDRCYTDNAKSGRLKKIIARAKSFDKCIKSSFKSAPLHHLRVTFIVFSLIINLGTTEVARPTSLIPKRQLFQQNI